ncbi:hypothetical protein CEK28_17305 [Xenophilus sp. AP218F]|nr:hypothetical protein CEK28_17305 [Xenophilus sp. AP218F]
MEFDRVRNKIIESCAWRDGLKWLLPLCIFLFGVTCMTVKGCANIFLFLAVLLSLPLLINSRSDRWSLSIFAVLSAPFLVTVLQLSVGMQYVSHKALDAPSRFFLAGLCLFALQQLSARRLAMACWGTWLGAFGVMAWGYISIHVPEYSWGVDASRGWNQFSNPIPFGVYSVILGFLALGLPIAGWSGWSKKMQWCIGVGGVIAGLVAGYFSGSRTPFLIVPPLVLIIILGATAWDARRILISLLSAGVLALFLIMGTQNKLHDRVSEGLTDIQVFQHNQNTSMGLRWEMWRTASQIIVEHPFAGVGKQGYYDEVNARVKKGQAPVIIMAAPHPHNELLNFGVEMGIPGVALGLMLFLVPAGLFLPRIRARDSLIRFSAISGSVVVVGQFVASLLDTYFWIVSQTAFYGVWVVVFAAIIFARRRELAA